LRCRLLGKNSVLDKAAQQHDVGGRKCEGLFVATMWLNNARTFALSDCGGASRFGSASGALTASAAALIRGMA